MRELSFFFSLSRWREARSNDVIAALSDRWIEYREAGALNAA